MKYFGCSSALRASSALLCCLLVICQIQNFCLAQTEWCYNDLACAATTWSGTCKSGKNQSPINIPYSMMKYWFVGEKSIVQNSCYFNTQNFTVTNNGHTIQAYLKDDLTSTCVLDGSFLGKPYTFSQIHFHWGSNFLQGSEHRINGGQYPMEAHLVHYNSKFPSFTAAAASGEDAALAVVAVFFKESLLPNPGLQPIIDKFSNVKTAATKSPSSGLRLASFLPQYMNLEAVQYHGSLTTPGCTEGVFWNIITNPQQISYPQMQAFRTQLANAESQTLVDNFRPTQSLNGRTITYSKVIVTK